MKKKEFNSTPILILIFLVGLSLLLYPTFSDYWNSYHATRVVQNYTHDISNMNDELYDSLLEEARAYNQTLAQKDNVFYITEEDLEAYMQTLNFAEKGVMGYIEIPRIDVSLPIRHTVDENVLQTAIGHVEWSSMPVGGESTHAVLSGHRGLPSAKLFTDLDKMEVGDHFLLYVLDETLTYEVDQILIVEPQEVQDLTIVEGEDLCTLLTCTPYGINTHRLLVRGRRVDNAPVAKTIRVTADAIQIEPMIMAPLLASPMLLVLLVWVMLPGKKKK